MHIEKPDYLGSDEVKINKEAIRISKSVVDKIRGDDGSIIISIDFRDDEDRYLPLTRFMGDIMLDMFGEEDEEWGLVGIKDEFKFEDMLGNVDYIQPKLGFGLNFPLLLRWFMMVMEISGNDKLDDDVSGFSNN